MHLADDDGMTLTLAVLVNAILMAGIVGVLARVMHLPFRIERRLAHAQPEEPVRDEVELSRAA